MSNSQSHIENNHIDPGVFKNRGKSLLIIGAIFLGLTFIIPPVLIFLSNFLPAYDEILFSVFYFILFLGVVGLILIVIGSYYYNKEESE